MLDRKNISSLGVEELRLLVLRQTIALNSDRIGIWDWNLETNLTLWDERMFKIYGLEKITPMPYENWVNTILAADRPKAEASLQKAISSKTRQTVEFRIITPDNTIKYIDASVDVLYDDVGKILRVIGTNKDITEKKEKEIKSQALFDNMLNGMALHKIVFDENNKPIDFEYVHVNKIFEEHSGLTKDEIIGQRLTKLFPRITNTEPNLITIYSEVSTTGKSQTLEFYFEDLQKWFLISVYSLETNYVSTISINITEDKKLKINLLKAQKIGLVGNWSFRVSDGKIQWSDEMYHIYGQDKDTVELNYDNLMTWIHPEDRELHHDYMDKMLSSTQNEDIGLLIYRIIQPNGNLRWVEINLESQFNESGILTSFFGTVHDITEHILDQHRLEEQSKIMIAQSRHAAMGEMISMIAHQWRQPLSLIAMDVNNMLVDAQIGELSTTDIENYAHTISEHTQHLSCTIDDFRNFFKKDKIISKVDIEEVYEDAYKIIKSSLSNNNIKLKSSFKTDKKVLAYPRELIHVFINIITNAKDALVTNKIKNATINFEVYEEEKYISTQICDNAGGIAEDILPDIFDPYFSTKDEKNGTGLGLYISKIIIEQHLNGILEVKNINNGTCFIVKLLK